MRRVVACVLIAFALLSERAFAQSEHDWIVGTWVRQTFTEFHGEEIHSGQEIVTAARIGTTIQIGIVEAQITPGNNLIFSLRPDPHLCPDWRVPLRVTISDDRQRLEWDQGVPGSGCRFGQSRTHVILTR